MIQHSAIDSAAVILSQDQLGDLFPDKTDNNREYRQLWQKFDQQARLTIDRLLAAETKLIEGKIPWLLSQYLPPRTPIFISNSMPVRYAEFFNPPSDRQIRPYFNRGANGIDGNLSTVIGIAYKNVPSLLLTGDLALLYESMGQYEQALPLYQQALKIIGKSLGTDHPDYATCLNNLSAKVVIC